MIKIASYLHKKSPGPKSERKPGQKSPGQGLVEFAIALPILLLLIFGIIEFGRLLQAWMAVQNAARFGLRYLVTGEYNPDYCDDAAQALSLTGPDTFGGDPANDCFVPDDYNDDPEEARDLTDALVDWARLASARDTAKVGATGIGLDDSYATSGDYLEYLSDHLQNPIGDPSFGNPDEVGYFRVTVCSSRDANEDRAADFAWDVNTNPETCVYVGSMSDFWNFGDHMDDAGGPGDRVRIVVTFNHPMIAPYLGPNWPLVPLTAWREGIVERFRTSRVSGIGSQIINAPPPPPTGTDTPTPTDTPTMTMTPTPTATPDCTCLSLDSLAFSNGSAHPDYAQAHTFVNNGCAFPASVVRIAIDWDYPEAVGNMLGYRQMNLDWIRWGSTSRVWGGPNEGSVPNDYASWTDTGADTPSSWQGPLSLNAGTSSRIQWDLDNNWSTFETDGYAIPNDFGARVELDVTNDGITDCTVERPSIERPLPEPDCDLYSMTDFTFGNDGNMQMTVSNGDRFGADITRIDLDWAYVEQLLQVRADTSLRTDWFSFAQSGTNYVWGNGQGGQTDYDSPTDTTVDAPTTWTGPLAFDPGRTYVYGLDLDKNSESPTGWLQNLGLLSSDFGITFNFNNGCLLQRTAVPRPIATPTPSCDLIFSDSNRISDDDYQIRVVNNNFAPGYLTYSSLTWPTNWSPNVMYFNYFQFRGNRYYDPAAAIYTSPVATAAPSIELPGNTSDWWISDFNNWPAVNGPGNFSGNLTFHFNNGLD
jgi:hypothetical protein